MDIINAFLHQCAQVLWGISWQTAILFGIILIISIFCLKASPNFKYWLWCIILLRLCVPMELNLPVGMGKEIGKAVIAVPDRFYEVSKFSDGISFSKISSLFSVYSDGDMKSQNVKQVKTTWSEKIYTTLSNFSLLSILLILWIIPVLVMSFLIIYRTLHIRSILKKCKSIDYPELVELIDELRNKLGIKHKVDLRYLDSTIFIGPTVIGPFKPAIYIPRQIVEKWSVEDIEPVLFHEMAHIKRKDVLINWLQIILQVIHFFNPLVWYVNWKIRLLREDACDDIAIAGIGVKNKRYSEKMFRLIKESRKEPAFSFLVTGFSETKSSISKRITRILSNKYKNHPKLTTLSALFLAAVAVISISLASGRSMDEKGTSLEGVEELNVIEDIYTKGDGFKVTINAGADMDKSGAIGNNEEKNEIKSSNEEMKEASYNETPMDIQSKYKYAEQLYNKGKYEDEEAIKTNKEAYRRWPNYQLKNEIEKDRNGISKSEALMIHHNVEALFQPAEKSYEEILAIVKARGKTGPIYFYSDDAVSTSVQGVVFNNRVFLKNYNSYFVGFKVKKKDKHGDELFKKFNITEVPTFALFNSSRELINKLVASSGPFNEFEKENWDRLLEAQNLDNSLIKLRERIAEQPNNYDIGMRYAKSLELSSQTLSFTSFQAGYTEKQTEYLKGLRKNRRMIFIHIFY